MAQVLPKSEFQLLFNALHNRGYQVMGPSVEEGSVKWDEMRTPEDLPKGWRDDQAPAQYRLEKTDSDRFFDVVHGPESLKRFAFAPREPLIVVERKQDGLASRETLPQTEKLAFLGVRACDLAGLAVQDRIFLKDVYPDPYYERRRRGFLLIAVNCTRGLPTCFCASMGTGPRARDGYDLALTELDEAFFVEAGTSEGHEILAELPLEEAPHQTANDVDRLIDACADSQERRIDQSNLPRGLYDAHEHPRWDNVATRCLACTNCTMVCPTCFCHTIEETSDLSGQHSERTRAWDSCYTMEHGYIHGKNIRPTIKDRYRQWLTHKVASWIDQFGTSGCVGCGRCITWCPVGIDLTEELHHLLGEDNRREV